MERIWIYQADRLLTTSEEERILARLNAFTDQWRAHGKPLAASAEIRHGLFVIVMVDDSVAPPTGCSIDKSVHLLKSIEEELGVGLFDRTRVAFRKQRDAEISISSREEFQQLMDAGEVTADTWVFNNLIESYDELGDRWEVPLADSWHARVFA